MHIIPPIYPFMSNALAELVVLYLAAELMLAEADDARKSYEAGIFARLEGVKAAFDPLNLFRDLNYVHPNVKPPKDFIHGEIYNSLPFAAADAMAPAPDTAMGGVEAPQPM